MILRRIYIVLVILFVSAYVHSQNLIINPSFEQCSCPTSTSQLYYAFNWWPNYWQGCSTELFNSCDTTNHCSTPINVRGYQFPHTGNGYAGFAFIFYQGNSYEVAASQLFDSLIQGREYCISFYVSLADIFSNYCIQDFTVHFTDSMPVFIGTVSERCPSVANMPFIYDKGVVCDKENWVKISGSFIATGNEKYMDIGCCLNPSYVTGHLLDSIGNAAYYYLDDVALYDCSEPYYAADVGGHRYICPGDSVVLDAIKRDNYLYAWYKADNPNDTLSKEAVFKVKPKQSTTYVLSQADFKFDYTFDTITVFVSEEYCDKPAWKIYPNPTKGELTFSFNLHIPQNTLVEFFDPIGRLVSQQYLKSSQEDYESTIDISTLAAGAYFCRIYFGDSVLGPERVVVVE